MRRLATQPRRALKFKGKPCACQDRNVVSWPHAGLLRNGLLCAMPSCAVLALFTVGDVYASLCKKSAYTPFSARRRS